LGLVVAATLGKLGGSMLTARWSGMDWHDSFALGALMNTRGLVELIVLNIGFDLGILSPRIFTMMVLMALVTTCMTGPLLSLGDFLSSKSARDGKLVT
jgi:Kef-type K+ transport system membrane component KefB